MIRVGQDYVGAGVDRRQGCFLGFGRVGPGVDIRSTVFDLVVGVADAENKAFHLPRHVGKIEARERRDAPRFGRQRSQNACCELNFLLSRTLDSIIRTRPEYDYDFRKDYLSWHIHYHLGADEKRGLARFMELLRRHGRGPLTEPRFVM